MNLNETWTWTEKILAVAVALQSFEFLSFRKCWSEQGLWRWSILRLEYPRTLRAVLDFFLAEKSFSRLLHARIVLSAFLLIFPATTFFNGCLLLGLFFLCLLTSVRWRGAFNGGSDSMTLITLFFAGLSAVSQRPQVSRFCLLMVATNLCLSFVIAGLSKLRDPYWRSGRALELLMSTSNYHSLKTKIGSRFAGRLANWFILLFEVAFPLAFLSQPLALLFISFALLFHVLNWRLFGLNRFLFAWGAAYPSLFYFAFPI